MRWQRLVAALAAAASVQQLLADATAPTASSAATSSSSSSTLAYAAVNSSLAVSYAVSPGFSRSSIAQDATFTHPELLRDYDPTLLRTCKALSAVPAAAQPKKTANVLVAISKCLQDSTIVAIANWATAKLIGDTTGGKVVALDGTEDVQLVFTFALVNATCSGSNSTTSNSNAAMATSRLNACKKLGTIANSFSEATNGKSSTASTASIAAVISFVESAAAYTTVEQYTSNAWVSRAFNFVVCEGSAALCSAAAAKTAVASSCPNANYIAQVSQIANIDVFPSTPRYSCDQVLTNGVPVMVVGASSILQCTCVCPRGFTLNKATEKCVASSTSTSTASNVGCAWDSYGTFKHQVTDSDSTSTSELLSKIVSEWGLPVPVIERSRTATSDLGQVAISFARRSDPTIYDFHTVTSAVSRHSTTSAIEIPLAIPSWAKTTANEFGNPISVTTSMSNNSSAANRTSTTTWRGFEISGPTVLDQSLQLAGFGVYNLEIRATRIESTPYAQHQRCCGCLAVTDHFRPEGTTACPSAYCDTDSCGDGGFDGASIAYFTMSNVLLARESIAGFANYQLTASNDAYSTSNRCDDMQIRSRSFYSQDSGTTITTAMSVVNNTDGFQQRMDMCFGAESIWSDLLQPPNYVTPISLLFADAETLQSEAPVIRQCTRCCWLNLQLRETWVDYRCDAEFATQSCEGLDAEASQCVLSQCLHVEPSQLVIASISILQEVAAQSTEVLAEIGESDQFETVTEIHRAVSCDTFDKSESCTFRAKLVDLVTLETIFAGDFQDELLGIQLTSYNDYGDSIQYTPNALDFVTWRYRIEGDLGASWQQFDLSSDEELAFDRSQTTIAFEAWSSCGKVAEQVITVNLHLTGQVVPAYGTPNPTSSSAAPKICERFDSMWYQTTVAERVKSDTLCNYPGSDFVELTFDFAAPYSGARGNSQPALPVTNIACFASFDAATTESGDEPNAAIQAQIFQVEGADQMTSSSSALRRFAVELRQNPTTEFLTNMHVSCNFTLVRPGGSSFVHSCSRSFTLASCEGPDVLGEDCTDAEALECVLDECAGKSSPGLFEACGDSGTIIRPDAAGNAITSQTSNECCQACGREIACVSLLFVPAGEQDLRRCELQSAVPTSTTAYDDSPVVSEDDAAYELVLPAEWKRSTGSVGRHAPILSVVTILAAAGVFVAGFAVRRRQQTANFGDAYVLLES